jgi:hypothetical protein
VATQQQEQTPRQKATWGRVQRIDPKASLDVKDGEMYLSYTPAWERGRHVNGEYRSNPNPQRCTFLVTEDGKIHGWGFGPVKVAHKHPITEGADMQQALKERLEARRPTPEPEAEVEVEAKPTKAAPRKRAKAVGVQVTAQ